MIQDVALDCEIASASWLTRIMTKLADYFGSYLSIKANLIMPVGRAGAGAGFLLCRYSMP